MLKNHMNSYGFEVSTYFPPTVYLSPGQTATNNVFICLNFRSSEKRQTGTVRRAQKDGDHEKGPESPKTQISKK